jgi:hypothetical protein
MPWSPVKGPVICHPAAGRGRALKVARVPLAPGPSLVFLLGLSLRLVPPEVLMAGGIDDHDRHRYFPADPLWPSSCRAGPALPAG